jgi:hypothetical protein
MSRSSYKVVKLRRMKCAVRVSFVGGNLTVKKPLTRSMQAGRIILKLIFKKLFREGVDWTHVFQERTRGRLL